MLLKQSPFQLLKKTLYYLIGFKREYLYTKILQNVNSAQNNFLIIEWKTLILLLQKLKEIQDAIEEAIKEIDAERKIIEINFPVKKDIAELFVSEYESAINAYETQKGVYKEKLSILETDLKSKGSSIFTSIKSTEIELVSLQSHLESIIAVIKKHNKWLDEFGERKSAAIKNFKALCS